MNRNENDRGAALIHVAAALLALMAFSTFVMDYGVYWTGRNQAQNSADAAAHAGAVALGFDSTDQSDTGPAKQSAYAETQRNAIWGQYGSVNITSDITFPTCPDGVGTCVRVDVYRTAARGNSLPMFFGRFVSSSLIAQDVRATATAEVGTADTTSCLRPFGIPDKWSGPGGIFNPAVDTYIPPNQQGATGYNLANDQFTEVQLKVGSWALNSGWFQLLDVGSGGSDVRAQIGRCGGTATWTIGDGNNLIPGQNGSETGPVQQGIDDLVALNGSSPATWDSVNHVILNNCVTSHSCLKYSSPTGPAVPDPSATINPQIIPVPVFNPQIQQATGDLVMVNIMGFFVEGTQSCIGGTGADKCVEGVFMRMPGSQQRVGPAVNPGNSFLIAISLVR
jgi:Flp pilus assembly protein TadG